jgi:tetratricopeptide (TPR) repeat protein
VVFSSKAQHNDALTCYDRALAIDVYNAEAWNGKGIVFAKAGDLNQALSCFKNAADLRENYTEAWANGALALKQLGLESKSEQAYAMARSLGYKNQTSPEFLANTEPQLMKEPEKLQDLPKKLPGFGATLALAVLLVALLAHRR